MRGLINASGDDSGSGCDCLSDLISDRESLPPAGLSFLGDRRYMLLAVVSLNLRNIVAFLTVSCFAKTLIK